MNKIDGSYRLLFSNPHLVRDLFNGIIDEPGLSTLDWARLTPLPSDYISDALRQRQGDCVWRVPRLDVCDPRLDACDKGDDLFILLMLEHQSTNDRTMALRITTYCALLYESLLTRKLISANKRLPFLLPVVLYSGVRRWTAPLSMAELIDAAPAALLPYVPQMRYVLVDESRLVRAGGLPANNLAALLFKLEHNKGIAEVQALMQTIWDRTTAPEYAEVRIAFGAWVKHVLLPRALPDVAIPAIDDLLEIKTMLTEHSRSWTHQWKAEGLKQGLQEGLQQGRTEGLMEGRLEGRREGTKIMLQRQLLRKFGSLSSDIQHRLDEATPAQLETWSLNVLDAATLDDVFAD